MNHGSRLCAWLVCAGLTAGSCDRKSAERESGDTPEPLPSVTPVVVRTLPHDTSAFTQGLLYWNGNLYESTGVVGNSSLRVVDPATGEVTAQRAVDGVFAEGLALHATTLVQLTWKSGVAVRYDIGDLESVGVFRYEGEGWGLTRDDTRFIMSNGTDTLTLRDNSFKRVGVIPVTFRGNRLTQLNELEWVNGKLYANVWHSTFVFEIDPATGTVLRTIDCSLLLEEAGVADRSKVLNGIAYRPRTGTFFLTGKCWPVMFEVRIPER